MHSGSVIGGVSSARVDPLIGLFAAVPDRPRQGVVESPRGWCGACHASRSNIGFFDPRILGNDVATLLEDR